jgi:hypothetical protein
VLSGGSNVTLSITGDTLGLAGNAQAAIYAVSNTIGTTSSTANLASLSFAGAGDVSVGWNAASWVVVSAPVQSAQTVGLYASSNTTSSASSTTLDARSLTIRGAGIASIGMSAGEVVISATSWVLSGGAGISLSTTGGTIVIYTST